MQVDKRQFSDFICQNSERIIRTLEFKLRVSDSRLQIPGFRGRAQGYRGAMERTVDKAGTAVGPSRPFFENLIE